MKSGVDAVHAQHFGALDVVAHGVGRIEGEAGQCACKWFCRCRGRCASKKGAAQIGASEEEEPVAISAGRGKTTE